MSYDLERSKKELLHDILDKFCKDNGIDSAGEIVTLSATILEELNNLEEKYKKGILIESSLE
tara:strand:+ start:33 stop:218 length:186 start_codon:yes stop_codon:yes gene_type:complete